VLRYVRGYGATCTMAGVITAILINKYEPSTVWAVIIGLGLYIFVDLTAKVVTRSFLEDVGRQ